MKNKYNYIAARETIEKDHEKELDQLHKCLQSWGMDENYIKEAIKRVIDRKMQLSFIEIKGELMRRKPKSK